MTFVVEVVKTYYGQVEVEAENENELAKMLANKEVRCDTYFDGDIEYTDFYPLNETE